MIPIERVYKIEQLLRTRRFVPRSVFLDILEISFTQFTPALAEMRDRLNAPIEWDRERGGYCFVAPRKPGPVLELPGLWSNASEVHALLTMQQLLKELEPGLLAPHVAPLLTRLKALLASQDLPVEEIEMRIRMIRMAARGMMHLVSTIAVKKSS